MYVFDGTNTVQKVGQITGLRETSQLRRIMETHVNDLFDTGKNKTIEKTLSRRMREANGGN